MNKLYFLMINHELLLSFSPQQEERLVQTLLDRARTFFYYTNSENPI